MEQIEAKNLKVSKIDFAILITCSFIFGYSYYTLTLWTGDFQHIMVYYIAPLAMGCLGLTYILIQNSDQLGMILLGVTAVIDLVFGIWWIVLQIQNLSNIVDFYDVIVYITNTSIYGAFYLLPGIACAFRAFQIYKKTEVQKFDVDFVSVLSLFAVSVLLVFNYNLFNETVFLNGFGGTTEQTLVGILAIVGLVAVSAGIYGNIKNQKIPMFVYILFEAGLWVFFVIVLVFIGDYPTGNGIWIFINAFVFLALNSLKAYQIQQGKSKDAYQSLV